MRILDVIWEYYRRRHTLYEIREKGGSGSVEDRKTSRRLSLLRRYLDKDGGPRGGLDVTEQIDAQVVRDRANEKVSKSDGFLS